MTLREAITAANNTPGPQTIAVRIPTSDPGFTGDSFWIFVEHDPPLILRDDATTIDGNTQIAFTGSNNVIGGTQPAEAPVPAPQQAPAGHQHPPQERSGQLLRPSHEPPTAISTATRTPTPTRTSATTLTPTPTLTRTPPPKWTATPTPVSGP